MKNTLSGIISLLKKNITLTASIAAVLLVLIILAAVSFDSDEPQITDLSWGDGITEGIPAFSGEGERFEFGESGEYAAAYYTGVTGEGAGVYIRKIEEDLGITFSTNGYPRIAIHGERIIAVHYSVTEMTFSVTVTARGDNGAASENTQSGVQEQ